MKKVALPKKKGNGRLARPKKIKQKFPPGWNEKRVRAVIEHYENQTEEEALAEDEAARNADHTLMSVPTELVPVVRKLIAEYRRST
jgi:hypothetical protein